MVLRRIFCNLRSWATYCVIKFLRYYFSSIIFLKGSEIIRCMAHFQRNKIFIRLKNLNKHSIFVRPNILLFLFPFFFQEGEGRWITWERGKILILEIFYNIKLDAPPCHQIFFRLPHLGVILFNLTSFPRKNIRVSRGRLHEHIPQNLHHRRHVFIRSVQCCLIPISL